MEQKTTQMDMTPTNMGSMKVNSSRSGESRNLFDGSNMCLTFRGVTWPISTVPANGHAQLESEKHHVKTAQFRIARYKKIQLKIMSYESYHREFNNSCVVYVTDGPLLNSEVLRKRSPWRHGTQSV